MRIFDLFTEADLTAALDARLITIRDSGDGQQILNYSDAALFTKGAWDNPAVRICRGLIIDADDGRVIARPFAKFFNYGQPEAGVLDLDAFVEVTDKMDGSLGILHHDAEGRVRVATRGSFQSEQAVHATQWLRERDWVLPAAVSLTPLVEIIYPANRIVCDYGDRDELVLLGGVNKETGHYLSPQSVAHVINWPFAVTPTFPYSTLAEALAAPPRPGAEGLCVRYIDEPRIVKIKQEDYVLLHRIVTGLSERSVWEHMSDEGTLEDLLGPLPDELHPWTRDVWERITRAVDAIAGSALQTHNQILRGLPAEFERKAYALQAMQYPDTRPFLFQILDGRDPRPSILKTLKPAGDTRARPVSEAAA